MQFVIYFAILKCQNIIRLWVQVSECTQGARSSTKKHTQYTCNMMALQKLEHQYFARKLLAGNMPLQYFRQVREGENNLGVERHTHSPPTV